MKRLKYKSQSSKLVMAVYGTVLPIACCDCDISTEIMEHRNFQNEADVEKQ